MKEKMFLYKALRAVFKPIFMFIYRPRIISNVNIPYFGSAVLAGNHKHALDPILVDICTKRVVRTLAKKELHDGKFGFLFRAVGTIPVDLHAEKNHDALEAAVKCLSEGGFINVSPEAKRNYTDHLLLPFKFGAVAMASRTKSPIIPYAITGSYKPFSKDLKILFGRPLYTTGDLKADNERLYKEIELLLVASMNKKELSKKIRTTYKEWENEQSRTS